jgi:hypothetical protein
MCGRIWMDAVAVLCVLEGEMRRDYLPCMRDSVFAYWLGRKAVMRSPQCLQNNSAQSASRRPKSRSTSSQLHLVRMSLSPRMRDETRSPYRELYHRAVLFAMMSVIYDVLCAMLIQITIVIERACLPGVVRARRLLKQILTCFFDLPDNVASAAISSGEG